MITEDVLAGQRNLSIPLRPSVILPEDAAEPAFVVYQNYRALMRWNRSHFFALTVGHLADRIAGAPPLDGF